jgi:hypothetical protein
MGKRFAEAGTLGMMGCLFVGFLVSSAAIAQEKRSVQYKVIKTQDFVKAANPKRGERVRVEILVDKVEQAANINGILASIPPASLGKKPERVMGSGLANCIKMLV